MHAFYFFSLFIITKPLPLVLSVYIDNILVVISRSLLLNYGLLLLLVLRSNRLHRMLVLLTYMFMPNIRHSKHMFGLLLIKTSQHEALPPTHSSADDHCHGLRLLLVATASSFLHYSFFSPSPPFFLFPSSPSALG